MVFSSQVFLFYFLPFFLAVYFLLPFKWKGIYLKNAFITVMSYVFYGWLVPWFAVLMFITTIKDYICGGIIAKPGQVQWKRKSALIFAIVADLGLLAYFKYYMFFMSGVNAVVHLLGGSPNSFFIATVLLPSGISFYTFIALSYTIDVYRGVAKPAKNFSMFSCFVGFFPHVIAGPITRYNLVAEQLEHREVTVSGFASGLAVFALGMGKKVILANSVASIANAAFAADSPGVFNAWWGIIAFAFQLYFDFCGYSDMAVGIARMIGIDLIKNFDGPYQSTSITVFWRKWHISLSNIIREYLYIPLGGNRRGTPRMYFNLAVSFFLCGLWHGASMTFVLWGVYQGAFLIFERMLGKRTAYSFLPNWGQVAMTFVVILFGWVLFRAPDIGTAVHYWGAMLGFVKASAAGPLLSAQIFSARHIFEMALCAILVWQPLQAHEWAKTLSVGKCVVCAVILVLAIALMFTQTYTSFLYAKF
jgi:alginate O-acetyltransferase complex protein AlgI